MLIPLSNTAYTIRGPVNAEDLRSILDVYRQCEDFLALGPCPIASLDMVRADLELSKKEGGQFCVIQGQDGSIPGIVDFVISGFEGDPTLAFLSLLMIAAPFRGLGLGASVVQAVESVIRQAGQASAIASGVQVNNPKAIRFWKRMGYQIVSGPEEQADGTTAYRLLKTLENR